VARKKYPLLPERSEYYPATVQSLVSRGGSATIEELEEDVARLLSLSEEALAIPHGDGRRSQFQYDLAWVRTYLKWARAVDNSERGVWRLTHEGAQMSEDELRGLWRRIVAEQRERRRSPAEEEAEELEPEPDATNASPELFELSWKEQLLGVLGTITSDGFERLCQRVLRESGFTKVEVTGRSGDGGIDGVGVLRVNLLSFQVLFRVSAGRDPSDRPSSGISAVLWLVEPTRA
jgi:restriction system protein